MKFFCQSVECASGAAWSAILIFPDMGEKEEYSKNGTYYDAGLITHGCMEVCKGIPNIAAFADADVEKHQTGKSPYDAIKKQVGAAEKKFTCTLRLLRLLRCGISDFRKWMLAEPAEQQVCTC
jgi:hypothetical protein